MWPKGEEDGGPAARMSPALKVEGWARAGWGSAWVMWCTGGTIDLF